MKRKIDWMLVNKSWTAEVDGTRYYISRDGPRWTLWRGLTMQLAHGTLANLKRRIDRLAQSKVVTLGTDSIGEPILILRGSVTNLERLKRIFTEVQNLSDYERSILKRHL